MEVFKAALSLLCVLLCSVGCSCSNLNICTANITESNNGSLILLYTRVAAVDNSSCMHYVWNTRGNFSSGYPTLFAAQTDNNKEGVCTEPCSKYLDSSDHSVTIPDSVDSYFSFGIVFTRLVEFVVSSTAAQSIGVFNASQSCHCDQFPNATMCQNYTENYDSVYLNDSRINWMYDEDKVSFVGIPHDDEGNETVTRIHFTLNFPTTNEEGQRLSIFPHTLFTTNSSTFDFVVENFDYQLNDPTDGDSANFSRIALEAFLIHGNNTMNGSMNTVVSLDDEYTPSVFTTITYEMPNDDDGLNGFLQWKPISYQSAFRKSTESQQVNFIHTSGIKYCDSDTVPEGLGLRVFGQNVSNITRWFAVFGTPGDQTFLPTAYISWTALVGYGQVPQDSISLVVIITIAVGLGIPALLMLLGGAYVFYKKKPWENVKRVASKVSGRQNGYTRLN